MYIFVLYFAMYIIVCIVHSYVLCCNLFVCGPQEEQLLLRYQLMGIQSNK